MTELHSKKSSFLKYCSVLFAVPLFLLLSGCASHAKARQNHSLESFANASFLPETYSVHAGNGVVLNHPYTGLTERALPTVNSYKGKPGCYVACYSHEKENSSYSVGNDIYVMGQV